MKNNIEALDKHLMQLKSNINNGFYGGASALLRDALHELDIIKAKANGLERSSDKCHIQNVTHSAYQLCPKCNGQGIVSKPPWVAGDVYEWSSTQTQFTCDVCNCAKIIPQHCG